MRIYENDSEITDDTTMTEDNAFLERKEGMIHRIKYLFFPAMKHISTSNHLGYPVRSGGSEILESITKMHVM